MQAQWRGRHVQRDGNRNRTNETDVTTQAATLAHEIAHSLLHWAADGHKITSRDGKEIDKQQRELEAEATAYVVCSYFGIQSPSDFYLATYHVTPAMLIQAVETIAATVKTILSGCQREQELDQVCAALSPVAEVCPKASLQVVDFIQSLCAVPSVANVITYAPRNEES